MKEVSPVIKYLLFGFNILFWLVGFGIFGIGIYAWIEKDTFTRLSELSIGILFDPAFIFLIVGGFIFIIGFCGCIGALRENTFLLAIFNYALLFILLAEIAVGLLVYFYQDKATSEIESKLKEMIKKYRDDEDLQDFIDWVQRDWLKCCGISDPSDWDSNVYFECRKDDQWIESCGVPPSCCLQNYINNTQCGFGARIKDTQGNSSGSKKIYTDGCFKKGKEWIKFNILPVSISIASIGLIQILGICFSQKLRNDITVLKKRFLRRN